MDRRKFLRFLGIGVAAAPVAAKVLAEYKPAVEDWSLSHPDHVPAFRGQYEPDGPWGDCATISVSYRDLPPRVQQNLDYHLAYVNKNGKIVPPPQWDGVTVPS
jgi:hypothetical protein